MRTVPAAVVMLLIAAVACVSCTNDDPAAITATGLSLSVTVDIFSGVPNPEWVLSEEESEDLGVLLFLLHETTELEISAGEGLGFRGFQVSPMEYGESLETVLLVTDGGAILGPGSEGAVIFVDPDHSVYAFLRASASEHLDSSLMDAIPVAG